MSDQVINPNVTNPRDPSQPSAIIVKQVSWPAIFSGTLVALATEALFLTFGTFIGFHIGPSGATTWTVIWTWVGAFFSLMAGGFVASRLSGNPQNGGLHGIVTWGVATFTTVLFLTLVSWGVISQAVNLASSAVIATAEVVPPPATPNEANRMANQAQGTFNQMQQQAPYVAQSIGHNLARLSLVLWIGIIVAACGSLAGGAVGSRRLRTAAPLV